jgi:hypothetical protein
MSDRRETLTALGYAPMPVLRAIRAKCLDCSGNSHAEVADCLVPGCALYPFRQGSNPWRAEVSEARREAARRLVSARQKARTIRAPGSADAPAGPETA